MLAAIKALLKSRKVINMKYLIDEYLPLFHFSETYATEVNAPAHVVYASVLTCDLGRSVIARSLFRLRGLPRCDMTMDGLQQIGFCMLARCEDREIVFGLIGNFWALSPGILSFQPEEFVSFDRREYAKAAGNLWVVPISSHHSRLITETRVQCTSSWSRACFTLYWTIIRPFSGLIRREWLRLIKQHAENELAV